MVVSSGLVSLVAVICLLGGPFIWGIFSSVCTTIEKISQQRAEANLKLEMIRRGFSCSEIERVCQTKLDSKAGYDGAWNPVPPAKPAKA